MAYLRNRTINLLNVHFAIYALAMNGGGVFFAVYLLKAGVEAPWVLGAVAATVAFRFVVRPLVLVVGRRTGLKPLTIIGTIVTAIQYPLLAGIHDVGPRLLFFCFVGAVGDAFYWTSYHAYFASLGDVEHRGHQISARDALASVMGIAGPLAAGWALVRFGAASAFGATAVVALLAAIPILGTPNVAVSEEAAGAFRAASRAVLAFAADGWIVAGYGFVWQIALFIALRESFTGFGAAMALAALAGAAGGLALGRRIDAGHGNLAAAVALASLSGAIVLRAVSADHPALAVVANASGALVGNLYTAALMTVVYNQAKSSPCALRFHIATEGGWDAGCAAGSLTAAALLEMGVPIATVLAVSLIGVVPLWFVLRDHYERNESNKSVRGGDVTRTASDAWYSTTLPSKPPAIE